MEELTPITTLVRGPGQQTEGSGVRRPGTRCVVALLGSVAALFEVGVVGLYIYGMRPDIFWGGKEDFPLWVLPLVVAFFSALLATSVCGLARKLAFEELTSALGVRCALTALLPALIGGVVRSSFGASVGFFINGLLFLTIFGLPSCVAGIVTGWAATALIPRRN